MIHDEIQVCAQIVHFFYSFIRLFCAYKSLNLFKVDVNFRKRTAKHSIPVIVDAEALAKMPAESIQTLRLKVGPQELKNDQ